MSKRIKKLIDFENRICAVLDQAAIECVLSPFNYTLTQTVISSQRGAITYTVIAGHTALPAHSLFVEAYVPISGAIKHKKWDGMIRVVVGTKEQEVKQVRLVDMIDTLQEIKDRLVPKSHDV